MGQGKSLALDSKNFVPGAPVISPSKPGVTGHTIALDNNTSTITVRWPDGSITTTSANSSDPSVSQPLMHAAKGERLTEANFKVNAVCCRGEDWKWGDQDKNGTGRLVSLEGKWAKVRWDNDPTVNNSENSYRCGADGKYDLIIYPDLVLPPSSGLSSMSSSTTSPNQQAGLMMSGSNFSAPVNPEVAVGAVIPEGCPVHFEGAVVGAKVCRGIDWKDNDNSDSNGEGILIAVEGKMARVRWTTNGTVGLYRAGPEAYDLLYAHAVATPIGGPTVPSSTSSATTSGGGVGGAPPQQPASAGTVVTSSNFAENALVGRGPDWSWGNQDALPGKLLGVSKSSTGDWARVKWADSKSNSYRIGAEGKHDLAFLAADGSQASSFSSGGGGGTGAAAGQTVTRANFVANAPVRRGPSWKWGNQDQNSVGILLNVDSDSWAKVRWPHGVTNSYRAGAEGAHDIAYAASSSSTTTGATTTAAALVGSGSKSKQPPRNAINVTNFVSGASIVRGPDWKYADQDKSGGGKLTSVDASGWVRVTFADGTSNSYRSGADSCWDVVYSSNPPTKAGTPAGATGVVSPKNVVINAKIVRGPEWAWGEQDKSGPGTLISVDGGWGKVKWPDGTSNSYRCGIDGKHDLSYAGDGSGAAATTTAATPPAATAARGSNIVPVTKENFVPNSTVVRGPTWKWGDQDKNGEGTMVSIDSDSWVRVTWKGGFTNSYRAGVQGAFDIAYPNGVPASRAPPTAATPAKKQTNVPPSSTTTTRPASVPTGPEPKPGDKVQRSNFRAGMTISRGPDWKWGDQDKNAEGKTLSIDSSDWVKVQWSDGTVNSYRGGASGAYDLAYGPKKTLTSQTKDLPDAKPTDNPDEACVVCLTNVREYCCVPCGHVVLCPACIPDVEAKAKKCPVCREPFQMLMRIYK